ncbi:hypothetical protein WMY93_015461 [Mugilogobius chulae]|uniref:Major facilitator superfamily (MFS) profile domain-containing protein n=1 Tax=Mugilogobius chulae TaxID=88201 RepID=A0AAW0NUT3_9GOBI
MDVYAKKMATDNSCKEKLQESSQMHCPSTFTGCSWRVAVAAMMANLSGLMLGYEMGLTSGVLLQLRGRLSLSCQEQEVLVSSHVFGALFICLAGGPILDRYGRRCSLLLSAALVVVGHLFSSPSPLWCL